MRKSQLDPLLARSTQEILAATCSDTQRSWYLSDLAHHVDRTASSLQSPLAALVEAGILKRWKDGNRVYFQGDENCPFLPEIRGLIAKTIGLVDVLREHLAVHRARIQVAFGHGSVARGHECSTSDVDLISIGSAGLRELTPALERAEEQLARPVNATVYSAAEFAARLAAESHYLQAVLDADKIFVLGTLDELEEIAKRRSRRTSPHKPAGARPAARRRTAQSRRRRDP